MAHDLAVAALVALACETQLLAQMHRVAVLQHLVQLGAPSLGVGGELPGGLQVPLELLVLRS